jgi:hypothetical protein
MDKELLKLVYSYKNIIENRDYSSIWITRSVLTETQKGEPVTLTSYYLSERHFSGPEVDWNTIMKLSYDAKYLIENNIIKPWLSVGDDFKNNE